MKVLCSVVLVFGFATAVFAQSIPGNLRGKWTIKRIMPTRSISCWDDKQAGALIGTEIEYTSELFRWKTTIVKNPVAETRMVTARQFHDENSGQGKGSSQVTFAQLGIKGPQADQVTIEHNPAEITAGTTEIPGDRVLVKSKNTIIVSACGVFFEAQRVPKRN